MSLVTRCPKCDSAFLVVLDQLRLHEGLVRCGHCSFVFDGFATLETDLPTLTRPAPLASSLPEAVGAHFFAVGLPTVNAIPTTTAAAKTAAATTPAATTPAATPISEPSVIRYRTGIEAGHELTHRNESGDEPSLRTEHRVEDLSPVSHPQEAQIEEQIVLSPNHDEPIFAPIRGAKPQRQKRDFAFDDENSPPAVVARILWALGIFAALVLLFAQLVFVFRNDIVRVFPPLRPILTEWCSKLKCEVSYSQRLERITIESTSLQQLKAASAENQTSTFNFLFTMRNRYDQQQAWPHLILSLKDASGTVVVRKIVPQYQYLPQNLLDQPFDKGQEVSLTLPLTVSGVQISGFLLDKYFP